MKGLGWDDMSRGSPLARDELRFYDDLKAVLKEDYGITYAVTENADEFYRETFSGDYDFVTVDLMDHESGKPLGRDIALTVRQRLRQDSQFPIFLLSSAPEEFKTDDAYHFSISPVAKHHDSPALIAQQITFRLKELGRFSRVNQVVTFARHAGRGLGGQSFDHHALAQLREIVSRAGLTSNEVSPERFSLDILDELRRQIQEAGRVIVLLTADEPVSQPERSPTHMARPNVYVELGLVLGVPGGNRKLILIQEEGAYLPSDVGSHQPLKFRNDLALIEPLIVLALQRRP